MTLAERLSAAQASLTSLEHQKRQIAERAMAVDIALLKATGVIELLQELIAEAVPNG